MSTQCDGALLTLSNILYLQHLINTVTDGDDSFTFCRYKVSYRITLRKISDDAKLHAFSA